MSHSSLVGIKEDYTGEVIYDFKNSWLFSPVIMSVLPDKYIPKFITTSSGFKKSIISDLTGEVFKRTNRKVNICKNTADRICWELANQQIFFTKDRQLVSDSIRKFVKQNTNYDKLDKDGLSALEGEDIIERFNEIADSILELDENKYKFFVFKNTSCDDEVEKWFERYDDKQDEYLECSMKDNIDNFYAEFVIIENGKIIKFISNRKFKY